MMDEGTSEFSGVAGKVLQRSVSGSSLVSGMVIGLLLIGAAFVFVTAGTPNAATPFSQIVMALALARFALNGRYGQWSGTVFSGVGGSWADVGAVGLRYLVLTAAWVVPLLMVGTSPEAAMAMGPMMPGKVIAWFVFYMMAMTLTPPLFLIVAVRADSFPEIFSPGHWGHCFGGRLGDLFVIYVVYAGTLGMVLVLSVPPVLMALNMHVVLGVIVGGLSFFLMLGVSVNLLGRLCGFYAGGEVELRSPLQEMVEPTPPDAYPRGDVDGDPLPAMPVAPVATQPVPLSPAPAVGALAPPPVKAPPPVPVSIAQGAVAAADTSDGAPLLDAPQRVEAALKCFDVDPEGCILKLKDLNQNFAPHPEVLHALTLCLHRAGHVEPAAQVARGALAACLERGNAVLAAEIYKQLRAQADRLELNVEELLLIASVLARKDEVACAVKAYSSVVALDAGDSRAIKGLLQLAEGILNRKNKPEVAAKVYHYLLENCAASPLAEFMRQGLEAAQSKMQPVAPTA